MTGGSCLDGFRYRGAQKREKLKNVKADWLIVVFFQKDGEQNKGFKNILEKNTPRTEYIKPRIPAIKFKPLFRIIKCQFGFRKVIYCGVAKNDNKLAMLFALASVLRINQMMRASRD